jgi:hypothetical protein
VSTLTCALVCVLLLLGSHAAPGRQIVGHVPLGLRAVGTSTCPGMCVHGCAGRPTVVHEVRQVRERCAAADAARDNSGRIALKQNSPNPFNPITVIEYSATRGADVRLKVYDSSGRLVRTLIDEICGESAYRAVIWNGDNDVGQPLSSGIYFALLESGGERETRKMVLLR